MSNEQATPSRVKKALDAIPVQIWIVVGVAVIVGISALFGGLQTQERQAVALPQISVGQAHVGPQFTVAVYDLTLMDVAPGYSFEADDGNDYLVATASITNNWTSSTIAIDKALDLEWLDEDHRQLSRAVLLSDDTSLPQANPRVAMDVAYVWQVPRGQIAPGDTVRVTITEASLRTDSKLTFGAYWHSPLPAALVDVVVGEKREPVEESE